MTINKKKSNSLMHEKSPYLLQHAHNPVDWYPWGDEAFTRARRENKPIFLSVGYSTCHWCHVMERESFENQEIAEILNKHFVSVKVDREERPDVDRIYMTYVQGITGSGGWPMSVWLTPDLIPFMGGTYYPPEDRWGRPGFKRILTEIVRAWKNDRETIEDSGKDVIKKLKEVLAGSTTASSLPDHSLLDNVYEQIKTSYDSRYGGFGGAPKFPRPSVPNFMLRYHNATGNADARDMILYTLRKMAEGGIYDHLGGGFHRYSVDNHWHVPHFEKMLYDQGQLACSYLDAFQLTKDTSFADVARGILDYVQRNLSGAEGGFYSAEDADSPLSEDRSIQAEGAFYVWEYSEITGVLDKKQVELFSYVYGIKPEGNVREDPQGEFKNKNILYVNHTHEEAAEYFNLTPDEIQSNLGEARRLLFRKRETRLRPHLDDKRITAWNGLMISAYARAYQVLGNISDLNTAKLAVSFIEKRLYQKDTGILLRRYREGEAGIEGYADDYAFLIQGLLDLYEASFNINYLLRAIQLQKKQDELFWDDDSGGYFSNSGNDDSILMRIKEVYDGAEPSPNSVSLLNLLRLSLFNNSEEYIKKAEKIILAFSDEIQRAPHAMPQMAAALAFFLNNTKQIIIAGEPDAPGTQEMLGIVHEYFLPHKVLMLADGDHGQDVLSRFLPYLGHLISFDRKVTAYICENFICHPPITNPERLSEFLADGHVNKANH